MRQFYSDNSPHGSSTSRQRGLIPDAFRGKTTREGIARKQQHEYHSAWQRYWQQYYHRHYLSQLQTLRVEPKSQQSLRHDGTTKVSDRSDTANVPFGSRPMHQVSAQAKKLRNSHHFMPLLTAVLVGALFMFLQYNRLITAEVQAYINPGSAISQNIIVDPTIGTAVSQDSRVIIPKMNVDAPVIYGVKSLREDDIQMALRDGVVHYPFPGANSLPGQIGNTVLLGHTSNDVFDPGNYKFVFVLIERLEQGDRIYVHHKGTRYTYSVTKKEVVEPHEVNKLVVKTDKPLITLVGCVPIGTADKRLLVTAEQISPDPAAAVTPPARRAGEELDAAIPGNSPTILDQLFNR